VNLIIRHIEHLITTHDCVVIPGIGAVLAHSLPARFDSTGEHMLAPVRVFTFNPALNHNDGAIASSISRAEGISYESASLMLDNGVAEMRHHLQSDSRLDLGRAGMLLRNSDGSLRFVPASSGALSPSTMWLPSVSLNQFVHKSEEPSVEIPAGTHRTLSRPRNIFVRITKMAAVVAMLVAVGIAVSTPVKMDNTQFASLGVESLGQRSACNSIIETPGHASAPVVLVIAHHADAATHVDTTAYAAMRGAARDMGHVRPGMPRKRYCLVVASLANEPEARRFVDNSKDSSLGILVKDGRYRVYAAEGATVADVNAAAVASGAKERYPDAWVCRK